MYSGHPSLSSILFSKMWLSSQNFSTSFSLPTKFMSVGTFLYILIFLSVSALAHLSVDAGLALARDGPSPAYKRAKAFQNGALNQNVRQQIKRLSSCKRTKACCSLVSTTCYNILGVSDISTPYMESLNVGQTSDLTSTAYAYCYSATGFAKTHQPLVSDAAARE